MSRNKDIEAALKRSRAAESVEAESVDDRDSGERFRPARSRGEHGPLRAPTVQRLPPLSAHAQTSARRGPSYPAWEKPPTQWDYPKLRGRDDHQTVKPLLLVAGFVAVVVIVLVAFQALTGRSGTGAVASHSPSHSASFSPGLIASGSGQPTPSAVPASPQVTPGTPRPVGTFQKYKVQSGDSVTKVAAKFHLQKWELLLANPQITDPNNLKLGTTIYIPLPGQLTPSAAPDAASPSAGPAESVLAP
jgi:LysM repeat protein